MANGEWRKEEEGKGRLTSREPPITRHGLKAMGDPEDDDEEEEEKKKSEEDEEEDNEGEEKEVPWQVADAVTRCR